MEEGGEEFPCISAQEETKHSADVLHLEDNWHFYDPGVKQQNQRNAACRRGLKISVEQVLEDSGCFQGG